MITLLEAQQHGRLPRIGGGKGHTGRFGQNRKYTSSTTDQQISLWTGLPFDVAQFTLT